MIPFGSGSLLAATSPAATNDRGVIHQLLVDAGVGSGTAHTVQVWTIGPFKVLVILVIAFVLTRLEPRLARRVTRAFRVVSPLHPGTPRGTSRAKTIAGVISAVLRAVIWIIALLTIFSELGLHLTPFVATATVVGAALGFGAQTLVKDFLSGMLILAEDQYGVGDSVVVGATTGTVEGVTLRVTRIRSLDGVVWYVPNGDIRTVGNNSEGDSQALVEVVVPLGTDLVAAGQVAEDEANAMAADRAWSSLFVGRPTFAGVTEVSADGATLRVMARTAPGVHERVSRELRLRILEALRLRQLAWVTPCDGEAALASTATEASPASGAVGGARVVGGSGAVGPSGARGTAEEAGGADPAAEPGDQRRPNRHSGGPAWNDGGPSSGDGPPRADLRPPPAGVRPPPADLRPPPAGLQPASTLGEPELPLPPSPPPTSRSSTTPPRRIRLTRWFFRRRHLPNAPMEDEGASDEAASEDEPG